MFAPREGDGRCLQPSPAPSVTPWSSITRIGQNRQSEFAQRKADHDFVEQEQELKLNTELTKAVHALAKEIYDKVGADRRDG